MAKLNVIIAELKTKIAEFIQNQIDLEVIYNPIETTEIPNLETDMIKLVGDVRNIQTVEIPALEIAVAK
jgi:hypothetical protein